MVSNTRPRAEDFPGDRKARVMGLPGDVERKLQVFISSTYEDLIDDRQWAVMGVLEAGHIPAGMELFASGNTEQLKVIKKWIDDCDVFLLILGGRYGSIHPGSDKSYIELEFDWATRERTKPVWVFCLDNEALRARAKKRGAESPVLEASHCDEYEAFKNKVRKGRIAMSYDGTKGDLRREIVKAFRDARLELPGWVRGKVLSEREAEMESLRTRFAGELAEAHRECENARAEVRRWKAGCAKLKKRPPIKKQPGVSGKRAVASQYPGGRSLSQMADALRGITRVLEGSDKQGDKFSLLDVFVRHGLEYDRGLAKATPPTLEGEFLFYTVGRSLRELGLVEFAGGEEGEPDTVRVTAAGKRFLIEWSEGADAPETGRAEVAAAKTGPPQAQRPRLV